ncbi:hypothetical protein [Vibrio phage vB_VpaS_CHI]|nr:hypothetical protein [Vibrio phage vB_VpaS_ALK]USL90121.1 hypothetical protein [Vibrio phage vB_VpaS_CHI]
MAYEKHNFTDRSQIKALFVNFLKNTVSSRWTFVSEDSSDTGKVYFNHATEAKLRCYASFNYTGKTPIGNIYNADESRWQLGGYSVINGSASTNEGVVHFICTENHLTILLERNDNGMCIPIATWGFFDDVALSNKGVYLAIESNYSYRMTHLACGNKNSTTINGAWLRNRSGEKLNDLRSAGYFDDYRDNGYIRRDRMKMFAFALSGTAVFLPIFMRVSDTDNLGSSPFRIIFPDMFYTARKGRYNGEVLEYQGQKYMYFHHYTTKDSDPSGNGAHPLGILFRMEPGDV